MIFVFNYLICLLNYSIYNHDIRISMRMVLELLPRRRKYEAICSPTPLTLSPFSTLRSIQALRTSPLVPAVTASSTNAFALQTATHPHDHSCTVPFSLPRLNIPNAYLVRRRGVSSSRRVQDCLKKSLTAHTQKLTRLLQRASHALQHYLH